MATKVTKKVATTKTATKRASNLEKYYISEKFDEKSKELTFDFKRANIKTAKTFSEFVDALKEYIRVSEMATKNTRVWFHRDGAYRGSVDVVKAKIIIERLTKTKVEKAKVIEFIESENLVDKPVAVATKKVVTELKEQKIIDLNEEAKKVKLSMKPEANGKKLSEVKIADVVATLENYDVEVKSVKLNNKDLDVSYIVKKGTAASALTIKAIPNITTNNVVINTKANEEVKPTVAPAPTPVVTKPAEKNAEDADAKKIAELTKEINALSNQRDALESKKPNYVSRMDQKSFIIWISVLIALICINILLLILSAAKVF